MMVGKLDEIQSALSSAVAFVVGEFEQNGMTVSMKPGKLVILTTHWRDRYTFISKCKKKDHPVVQ